MSQPQLMKQDKMAFVAEHVLRIVLAKGIGGLSYAQVARSSGVSRPWLYKYVGQTKNDLVNFAVVHFGKVYSALDVHRPSSTREEFIENFLIGVQQLLDATVKYPWVLPLYYRYAGTKSPIGDTIAHLESLYLAKVVPQIDQFLKPTKAPARVVLETLMAMDLGICLRYLNAAPRDPDYSAKVKTVIRGYLESVS